MSKFQALVYPISMLKAKHNLSQVANWYSNETNSLQSHLCLTAVADLMLPYNLWIDVGLHNGNKDTVIGFVYNNSEGPRSGEFPEAVVAQFQ